MFIHKKCGNEVLCKSLVYEYAPILRLDASAKYKYIEAGDVMESVVEDTTIWCENCGIEVDFDKGDVDETVM